MENLEKRIEDSFKSVKFNDYTPLEISQISHKWAEEVREITIEFAKQLMEIEVTKCNKGKIGEPIEKFSYLPYEYSLMKGELIQNGEQLFDKFIEEYYE